MRLPSCVAHFKIFEKFSHEEHPAKAKEEGLCGKGGGGGGEGGRVMAVLSGCTIM